MNILFVFHSFPSFGGIESVSNNLIDFIGEYHNVYSISLNYDSSAPFSSGLKAQYVFPAEDYGKKIEFYNDKISSLEIDIVVNQGISPDLSPIVFNSRRNRQVKVISALHSVPGHETKLFWNLDKILSATRYKKIERRILSGLGIYGRYNTYLKTFKTAYRTAAECGDKIVLLTEEYKKDFIKRYHLNKWHHKICSIENSLSASFSKVSRTDWIGHKKNNILYVGRLCKEKRVDVILDLWRYLAIEDWHLYIVGDGPERKRLENIAKDLKNVHFTGFISDVRPYYRSSKILLLTSEYEGFGMCLIEAQKFGVIPVAYNISTGVRDILRDKGGILVRNNDFSSLCAEVMSLMKQPDILSEMSLQVYDHSSAYNIEIIGRKWLALFQGLMESKNNQC